MINIIVACARNRVIGNKGIIPWDIADDMEFFKENTVNNIVIMGRKSYEEIGQPLPKRETIVISKTKKQTDESKLYIAESLKNALEIGEEIRKDGEKQIFICGGESVYKEGLKYADTIMLTEIDRDYKGDTYFPEFDKTQYQRTIIKEKVCYDKMTDESIRCSFVKYTRRDLL